MGGWHRTALARAEWPAMALTSMENEGIWALGFSYPAPHSDHLREPRMSRRHAYSLVGQTVSILTGQRLMGRWGLPGVGSADLQNTARWTTAGMLGAAYVEVLGKLWRFLGQANQCIIDGCSAEFACRAAGS